jgi:exopolyphosphatase/guanosine-5'-triphosphate,3'-diphosphate pyrophosphatase
VERRLAVIDLGSNSFRLVVFTYTEDWWKRTDEIYEPVRVGEHQEAGGPLQPEPMERALETIELFAHFCRATDIERIRPLATSAIREASNRDEFVRAARERSGLEVEVLSREQEARYGYLAVVNSTTLSDGVALDIGGGSMQLTHVEDRLARDARSWRLGAVVMTERFLTSERGDVILAGAIVVQSVMEAGGFEALEVTEAGLREGAFFEELLGDADPPLLDDVRAASVRNLAAQYHPDTAHTDHVARLALEIWDALAEAGVHPGDAHERELLWAAAELHDVGTAVDYDDHHKHSRYLILNAGLPGFSPRETALIGQAARYHRKGQPGLGEFAPLARKGDEALLARCAAALRLAEQLERPRDQTVRHAQVVVQDGRVELRLQAKADVTISRWAAQRQADLFERAFGKELEVVAP